MWGWIVQNKEWLFSGAGIAIVTALWWLSNRFWAKRESPADSSMIVHAPSSSVSPVITVSPTINFPTVPPAAEPEKASLPPSPAIPKPRPNLCVEATRLAKLNNEGDVWTLKPSGRYSGKVYRALLADISNVPTDLEHTAKAAVRAGIRMAYGGRQRTYSPLPWLDEYLNTTYLETGARKIVVLAVGEDSLTGSWHFVLNHRSDFGKATHMDWSNPCPIPSDLPFEILMIDMNSGGLLKTFAYVWTFDANLNWPTLKSVD